ncbi:unnamed protein product [Cylicocyclus nassatus]|uniref:Uncharacterized protein n=1 Tax=Cylicocyclus nassatus TaxID=53992 RepID=A0AA36GJP6_CYLNA|nr:unnamed protein product [Cylicocyclus nassatus]
MTGMLKMVTTMGFYPPKATGSGEDSIYEFLLIRSRSHYQMYSNSIYTRLPIRHLLSVMETRYDSFSKISCHLIRLTTDLFPHMLSTVTSLKIAKSRFMGVPITESVQEFENDLCSKGIAVCMKAAQKLHNAPLTDQLKEKYEKWWTQYEKFTAATKGQSKEELSAAKKALREEQAGLLGALALPNFVDEVGKQERPMSKSLKHCDYLVQKGHMRVDKEIGVFHLTQFLEMFEDAILVSLSYFARAAILEGVNVPVQDFVRFTDESDTFPPTYLGTLLDEGLKLDIKARKVTGKESRNFETQAVVFEDKGLEVARKRENFQISWIGD